MDLFTVIFIALALAMDAGAVAVGNGMTIKKAGVKHMLVFGLYFGAFQFVMYVAGWLLGSAFAKPLQYAAHWLSFVLLAFIGTRMIVETLKEKSALQTETAPEDRSGQAVQTERIRDIAPETGDKALAPGRMTALAVATSLDALAAGLSFAMTDGEGSVGIWVSALIVGGVAFVLSAAGLMLGKKIGSRLSRAAGLFGGIVLILIGIKILIESFL